MEYAKWIKATFTVNGAVGETITYVDQGDSSNTGTIVLDSDGKNTDVILSPGTYTFTSDTAKNTTSVSTYYDKTVTVTSSTTEINFYPDGAIYWYGNGTSTDSSLYSVFGGVAGKTNTVNGGGSSVCTESPNLCRVETNNVASYISNPSCGSQTQYYTAVYSGNSISIAKPDGSGNYSSLKFNVTPSPYSNTWGDRPYVKYSYVYYAEPSTPGTMAKSNVFKNTSSNQIYTMSLSDAPSSIRVGMQSLVVCAADGYTIVYAMRLE